MRKSHKVFEQGHVIDFDTYGDGWIWITKGAGKSKKKPRRLHESKLDAYLEQLQHDGYELKGDSWLGVYAVKGVR